MAKYIAMLRAVNVGGATKLSMADLKAICFEAGFNDVETYIASGNVVFSSKAPRDHIKSAIEAGLRLHVGKPVGVILRTADEMRAVLDGNPFPEQPASFTVAIFLDEQPPADALNHAIGGVNEEMRLGAREIYVHYGAGMGRSKLKIPAAQRGTARNMNTIARLVSMACEADPTKRHS